MKHPTSRAERRRINKRKDYGKYDREIAVQQQLEAEAAEQKQIIEDLRRGVDLEETLD
jgi:hypothetical protein